MRNREAERYARMAAMAAGAIVLLVAGVYLERSIRQSRARRGATLSVPSEVQQQSDNFSYSDVEQGRTVFTVRASHATQYKDQNRALLQDVWITVYGREGNRDDNIHTRQCNYEPLSGGIRCQGDVQIDVQGANPGSGKPEDQSLHIKTSDLTFNRQTGEADTAAPVEFRFPQGQGHGVGVSYSTRDAAVRVNSSVAFDLNGTDAGSAMPVHASGSSLEIRRTERTVTLDGPAMVSQGDRELTAGKITIELDENFRARKALAEGSPAVRGAEGRGKFRLTANQFQASLDQQGWIESVVADGNVAGTNQTAVGTDHFSSAHADFAMLPQRNLVREITANGGVAADSKQGADERSLKTDALRVAFAATAERLSKGGSKQTAPGSAIAFASAGQQRIESVETLAPASIESKAGNETTHLNAKKFVAQFDSNGRLEKLLGHSGVEIRRRVADGESQSSSANELVATLGTDNQWDSLDETGDVRFEQGDRRASAARARMNRSSGTISLEGSPVISDSDSRTTASSVDINEQSGEIRATGGVVSTYLASAANGGVNIGSGPAHISADTLSGSTKSGHVVYEKHARLWQGESVLQAEKIELWRDDKKMIATGHVEAVFPQAPGSGPSFATLPGKPPAAAKSAAPTLWRIHAPSLTYWDSEKKAHLEGGVTASSDQGSLESRTLDVFLAPPPAANGTPAPAKSAAPPAGQLDRILAQGDVIVRQDDRRGTSEQAEYTAADQKFVLSGGKPTLTNAANDMTTGHSLTFYVASDTILIESQEGSRTLTKHRVEK